MNAVNGIACLLFVSLGLSACDTNNHSQALGTIERDRVILKSTASEIIVSEPVAEGSVVTKGTLLVQLDDRRQKAMVAKAKAQLAQTAARLAELRSGAREEDIDAARAKVNGAEATYTATEKAFDRAVDLRSKNLNSQAELDRIRAERDAAKANLNAAEKNLLVLTNGTRKEELDQADAQYNAAQAQLDLENYVLSELSVTATRDGYLDSLPWNEGERVQAGSTVAVLLACENTYSRVYVPEPARAQLHIGDERSVKVDGVEKNFTGRLRWLASEPAFTPYYALNETDRARLVYLAEFDVIDGADLPIGVPAQVLLD